jgi:hypothetical protein
MNKRTKEKRFLDEDDLTGINNTFAKMDITFQSIREDIKRTNESIREELKHLRDVNDIREKANDIRYYTLLAVISFFGILLSIFKVLF